MKHAQGRERRHVDAKQLYDAFSFARRLKSKKRKKSEKSIWVKSVSKQRRKQKGNFHSGNYEITSVAMKNTKGAFSKFAIGIYKGGSTTLPAPTDDRIYYFKYFRMTVTQFEAQLVVML